VREEIAEERAAPPQIEKRAVAPTQHEPPVAEQRVVAERRVVSPSTSNRAEDQPSVVMSMIRIQSEQDLRTTVNRMRHELREQDLEVTAAGTIDGETPMHMFIVKPPRADWPTLAKAPQRALQLSTVVMVYEQEPNETTLAFIDRDGRRYVAPDADVQAQGPGATPMTETQIHARAIRMALEQAAEANTSPPTH
jgi:hypothetical protein